MRTDREIELLVEENTKLVHFVIRRYCDYAEKKCRDLEMYEDMYQEGLIGLYKAAKIFDETKGYKFSTIAVRYIHGHIFRWQDRCLKKQYRNQDISLEKNIGNPGEVEFFIPITHEEIGYKHIECKEIVDELRQYLNDEERRVLELRMEGYTQAEIGRFTEVSQVTINRRMKGIRRKLKKTKLIDEMILREYTSTSAEKYRISKERKEKAKKLHESGLSRKEIATRLNVTSNMVSIYLKAI